MAREPGADQPLPLLPWALQMDISPREPSRQRFGVSQTRAQGWHRDAHSAQDLQGAVHLWPPLGGVDQVMPGESQQKAEPGLCPVFSSARDPFQSYQNLRGYFLLTGPWRRSENRGGLRREWRRNSVLWIQYQLCDFPPPRGINIVLCSLYEGTDFLCVRFQEES